MEESNLQQKAVSSNLPVEELKRLSSFFEILIQIDQRERRKENENIPGKINTNISERV